MSAPELYTFDERSATRVGDDRYAAGFRDALDSLMVALRLRGVSEADAEALLLDVLDACASGAGRNVACRGPEGAAVPDRTRAPFVDLLDDHIYAVRFVALRYGCAGGTTTRALLDIETGVVVDIESWQPQVFLQGGIRRFQR